MASKVRKEPTRIQNESPAREHILRRWGAPFLRMAPTEISIRRQPSQSLHLFVDSGQQFPEDWFHFFVRCTNEFLVETSDSVIDAAQRHSTISLGDIISNFANCTIPYVL
jgi:hypothetical protein